MEIAVGLIVIAVIWAAIAGRGAPAGGVTPAPRPAPRRVVPPAPGQAPPSPAQRRRRQLGIERERHADAAFVDGVLFSHYFLEPRAEDAGGDDVWDDGFGDDGYDDGMYD